MKSRECPKCRQTIRNSGHCLCTQARGPDRGWVPLGEETIVDDLMSDDKCPDCGARMGNTPGCEHAEDGGLEFEHTELRCLRRQLAAKDDELEQAKAACADQQRELDTRWSFISTQAKDLNAMSDAGGKLAVAAARVLNTYDGVHRLADALSGWMRVIADEGGRGANPGKLMQAAGAVQSPPESPETPMGWGDDYPDTEPSHPREEPTMKCADCGATIRDNVHCLCTAVVEAGYPEKIDQLVRERDHARAENTQLKDRLGAAEQLCEIYFNVAAGLSSDAHVRAERDKAMAAAKKENER